jgi:hypothetical protein
VADYVKNSPAWADGAAGGTPLSAARLNNMETQYDRAKEGFTARLRWRGVFAPDTDYSTNDVISQNGTLYRARTAHLSAGTGPDTDGDPTYWEVLIAPADPATFGPDTIDFAQVAGLDEAFAARLPAVILATEATPVPAGTPDPAIIYVLEP